MRICFKTWNRQRRGPIEHRTSNADGARVQSVRRWMFNVRCSMFAEFPAPSRRSPGCKAQFSSGYPAPASWTAPAMSGPVSRASAGSNHAVGNRPLPNDIRRYSRLPVCATGGFTLIEAILAVAISAIVLVTISLAFSGALQLREHAAANLEKSLPIERAMDVIQRDLKNAVPPGGILEGPMESGALQSGVNANEGIQLYTTTGQMTADAPWSEIQKVSYSLQIPNDARNNSKDLVRTVTRNLLATATQDENDQILMSGVDSLNFSYFDGTNWMDTWDASTTSNLPVAIRVSMQLAAADSGARPQPYQMVVPLMAQVATNQLNDINATNTSTGGF